MTTTASVTGVAEAARSSENGQVTGAPGVRSSALTAHRYFDAVLLALGVLVMTVLNLVWVVLDNRPPYWDMARHLGDSLITQDSFSLAHPLRFLTTYVYYPPFAYWVSDAFYAVLGRDQWVGVLSQSVFLAVLVYSTYGIGKLLWNRRVGLLAAFFVATTPMFVSMFKWYMLDPPLAAMSALALYLLLRCESFTRTRFALLLGVVCGLGMLTKWTFPLVVWLPIAVALFGPLRSAVVGRNFRPVANAAGAGLIAFAICGVWYVHNYSALRTANDLFNKRAAGIEGDPAVASLPSVLWYAWNLLNEQLYLVPFVVFVVGLVYVFRKNDSALRNTYPMLMIAGSYVAFTLLHNKDYRFTMPMLPAVAIVAVSWLEYVRPRTRRLLTGGIVVYGAVAFLAISFGTGVLPKDWTVDVKPRSYTSDIIAFMPGFDAGSATRAQGIVLFAQHGWLVGPPSNERWHQEDLFKDIAARSRQPDRTFWFTGGDSIWFNTWGTRYYAAKYRATWVGSPDAARFLIVRGDAPAGVTSAFVPVSQYQLPDAEPVWLYERV